MKLQVKEVREDDKITKYVVDTTEIESLVQGVANGVSAFFKNTFKKETFTKEKPKEK